MKNIGQLIPHDSNLNKVQPYKAAPILFILALLLSSCQPAPAVTKDSQPTSLASPALNLPEEVQAILPSNEVARASLTPGSMSTVVMAEERPEACTHSHSYWGQNPDRWLTGNFVVGKLVIGRSQALLILTQEALRETEILLQQFLAAVLNTLNGVDASSINLGMIQAGQWLDQYSNRMYLPEAERIEALALAESLLAFNRGEMGPQKCADEALIPSPEPPDDSIAPSAQPSAAPKPTAAPTRAATRTSTPSAVRTATSTSTATPQPSPTASSTPTPTPRLPDIISPIRTLRP